MKRPLAWVAAAMAAAGVAAGSGARATAGKGEGTNVAAAASAAATHAPAQAELDRRLRESLDSLDRLRREIGDAQVPLAKQLSASETELLDARRDHELVKRQLDGRSLDMNNLRAEIKTREQEKSYLSSLLVEYVRNLETRMHIAELGRHQPVIEAARLAPENSNLKPAEVFAAQVGAVDMSLGRLDELLGGARFDGRAAGRDGIVKPGAFLLLGPVAFFASSDGSLAGVAEQRLGSIEAAVEQYADPAMAQMTRDLVRSGRGQMPFDATMGNARKMEETQETLREHILKGGAVMAPILGLAALIVLVVVVKWIGLTLTFMPGAARIRPLLDTVGRGDKEAAAAAARRLRGPAGRMLRAGVENLSSSKDHIEEVMFEKMLDARFRMNRWLPFIAVGAACAPLLGLLGTVTGIITTFKLITVFGSGDIKMLSAGISEALITTEYGLYVAIPSLLSHAFLSRKAKSLSDRMERIAIGFLAEVTRAAENREAS